MGRLHHDHHAHLASHTHIRKNLRKVFGAQNHVPRCQQHIYLFKNVSIQLAALQVPDTGVQDRSKEGPDIRTGINKVFFPHQNHVRDIVKQSFQKLNSQTIILKHCINKKNKDAKI